NGFNLRAAYTLAKTIDMTSGLRARSSGFTNPLDHRIDRALADFDATYRLVLSWGWILPVDRLFHNNLAKTLTKDWQFSGIVSFQSGSPFGTFSGNNSSLQNSFAERPDRLGHIRVFGDPRQIRTFSPLPDGIHGSCLTGPATGRFYFDPTNLDCANVPLFTFGTMGRNALRGPGINNWDLSIMKKI